MNTIRRILGISLLVFFVVIGGVQAQDEVSPTPEAVVETTADATEAVVTNAAPVVEVSAVPTEVITPVEPVEELPPAVSTYREIVIWFGAFVTTVLIVMAGVIGGLIKSNATIAKYAADNFPVESFQRTEAGVEYLQGLARTFTPKWDVDDRVLAGIRQEIQELRQIVHPGVLTRDEAASRAPIDRSPTAFPPQG